MANFKAIISSVDELLPVKDPLHLYLLAPHGKVVVVVGRCVQDSVVDSKTG